MEPPISFDRVATRYEATRALPPELHRFAVAAIRTEVGDRTLLDVGVGTGRYALALQAAGVRLTGCDVSSAMLREGWGRGVRGVCRADARRLPFRDGGFECAMTNSVLHLVRDWPGLLREVVRVTRGRYLSVLAHETSAPDLYDEYYREVGALIGPTPDHPGIHARDLVERLPPDRRRSSGTVARGRPADEVLDVLEHRLLSSQWALPDDAHAAAAAALRRRFGGTTVNEEVRVELVVWEMPRLDAWVRSGPAPTLPG